MLGKLTKHELKAMLNKFLFISIIFLSVAIMIRILSVIDDKIVESNNNIFNTFMMTFTLIVSTFSFALVILNIYALFISASRFHKNLFSDEGYLMHTIPVPSYYHIIAKFVAGIVTWILSSILIIICVFIAFLEASEITMFVRFINNTVDIILKEPLNAFLSFLVTSAGYCALILMTYFCTAVSNLIKRRQNAVITIMIITAFILNNIILSILFETMDNMNINSFAAYSLAYTGYFAIVSVIFFFFTNRIISRNLNLE